MPIYVYGCPTDGLVDVFFRSYGTFPEWPCPECGAPAARVATTPALVSVKRDWNEKANDYQRDPYTQSKAQLTNMNRTAAERGEPQTKITEEAIQVGAKAIAKQAQGQSPGVEQRYIKKSRTE